MEEILRKVAAGELSIEDAVRELKLDFLQRLGDFACLDIGRELRRGVPEIIFAEGKPPALFAEICVAVAEAKGYALATRVNNEQKKAVKELALKRGLDVESNELAKTLLLKKRGWAPQKCGKVGVLSAGTADAQVAEEASVVAEVMGCEALKAYDVGIAGIHRLKEPLEIFLKEGVAALIVVAGMEGALPSVVASLVDVPVVGVPTSVGYGLGGGGLAALLSMLQSCALGLAVVNIDNGVAAGVFAALIAKVASQQH
ncbi:MAG: nickel pincer cofactor biosynthesis protein LarB [Candidatus Alkanophagales archaeon]|nr:MAG: nickel pincer cofactor biosynthesis protein LarB [Candidatus Alkanophagales archaeon]